MIVDLTPTAKPNPILRASTEAATGQRPAPAGAAMLPNGGQPVGYRSVGATNAYGGQDAIPEDLARSGQYMIDSDWMLGRTPDYAKNTADNYQQIGNTAGDQFAGMAGAAINQGQASAAQFNTLGGGGMYEMANLGARQSALGQGGLTGLSTMAGQAMGIGQQAQGALTGYGGGLDLRALGAANRYAPRTNYSAANATQGGVMGRADQLAGLEAVQGPSAAQAQLQSGLNAAQASNLALARSGRGWGGNAAALAQAQGLNAAAGQQAATQAAMLRAQEDAAWRQRQAANLGAAGQLGTGIAGQQINQAQFLTDAQLRQTGLNDQAQIAMQGQALQGMQAGYGLGLQGQQMGIDAYNQGLQYAMQGEQNYADIYGRGLDYGMQGALNAYNAGMGGLTLGGQLGQQAYNTRMGGIGAATDVWRTQSQMDMAREQNVTQRYGIESGVAIQNQGTNLQLLGAGLTAAGAIGGAMIGGPAGGAAGGAAGAAGGSAIQRAA